MSRFLVLTVARLALVVSSLLLVDARPVLCGGVSFLDAQIDDTGGVDGLNGANAVAVSPDGANVYVTARSDDAVAVFNSFGINFVEFKKDGVGGVDGLAVASSVTVSPDGQNVYVTSEGDDAIAVFGRSAPPGSLTFVEEKTGIYLAGARSIVVSPDGKHVYTAAANGMAVAVFSRNAMAGGTLTFVESHFLEDASAVAVSPDGAHVYAGGGEMLVSFSRNAMTGALTPIDTDAIGNSAALAVSADGKNVYLADRGLDVIQVFARDGTTGVLTFLEIQRDNSFVHGLKTPRSLAVSPDGRYLYAVGSTEDAITVFRRNTTTGRLTFLEEHPEEATPVLNNPYGVAVNPLVPFVYVADRSADALLIFAVDVCGDGNVGNDEQCDDGNTVSGDGCSSTCRLELCGSTPSFGCRKPAPGQGRISLKDSVVDTRDAIDWRWLSGQATDLDEFGHPLTTATYLLCVYDSSAAPQPLMTFAAPSGQTCDGGACWEAKPSFYSYRDKLLTSDGLLRIKLQAGAADGEPSIVVKGKGANAFLPPLALALPATVQLKNTETGVCWDAVYSSAIVNAADRFKAKSD